MAKEKKAAPAAVNTNAIRRDSNRAMRLKQHLARVARKQGNPPKVARGTKRAKRREAAAVSGIAGDSFPERWKKFCDKEKGIQVQ